MRFSINKKVFIILILVITLFNSIVFADTSNKRFNDIEKHWAKIHITKLIDKGIISGYGDGTFRPNNNIKIDEYLVLVIKALGYTLELDNNYWAKNYIEKAKELGLIYEGQFSNYRRLITREEMTYIIVNATTRNEEILDSSVDMEVMKKIPDYYSIDTKYMQHIIESYKFGLIVGSSDGRFKPKQNSTRAEASTVIIRYLDTNLRLPFGSTSDDTLSITLEEAGNQKNYYNEGNFIKVDVPVSENGKFYSEIIETAKLLKELTEDRNKAYGEIVYNPKEKLIYTEYFRSADEIYRNDIFHTPKDRVYIDFLGQGIDKINLTMTIKTANWGTFKTSPYNIAVWDTKDVKEYHLETIEELFKYFFKEDYLIALNLFNEYLNEGGQRIVTKVIGTREVSFVRYGGESFDVYISLCGEISIEHIKINDNKT